MRYLFLIHTLVVVAVIAIGGYQGMKSGRAPVWVFPDMDIQGKVKAQKPAAFFADGVGARPPVAGTVPLGYAPADRAPAAAPRDEFGTAATGYYHTGRFGDFFGSGMPDELALTPANAAAFLRRGQERYLISCAPCHGAAANGQGVVAQAKPGFTTPIRNLHDAVVQPDQYADGAIFSTITHGKGVMSPYGDKLTLRDRWAVVAWVRVLQRTEAGVPATDPGVKELLGKARPADPPPAPPAP